MTDRDDELKKYFNAMPPPQDEFSFDPEGWKKMSATLKAERKSKKLWFFIYLNMFILVAGITTAFFLFENEKSLEKSDDVRVEEEKFRKQKAELKNTEPALTSKTITEINKPVNVSEKNVPANPSKTKTPQGKSPTPKKQSSTLFSLPYMQELRVGRVEISLTRVFSTEELNEPVQEEKRINKNVPSEDPEISLARLSEERRELVPEIKSKTTIESPQSLEKDSVDSVLNKNTKDNSTATEISEKPADTLPGLVKTDSVLLVKTEKKDTNSVKFHPKQVVSIEAGSTYLLGWKNSGKTDATGFNPILGINYFNEITDKVGVSIGLQYTTINNLKQSNHTSTSTKLKFGEEVDVITISARKMHYLVAPLKLVYFWNEKNSFGAGYNLAYLVDVKSEVKTHTERFNQTHNHKATSAMGYRKGFSDFDGQVSFSYRRLIYKNLFVNAEIFYGLKDIKNNAIYKTENFERNAGFKLNLSYNIYKK